MEDIQLISLRNKFPENNTMPEMVLVTLLGIAAILVGSGIQLRLYFLLKAKGGQGIGLMILANQVSFNNQIQISSHSQPKKKPKK